MLLSRTTGDLLDDVEPGRKPYRHIVVDEAQDVSPAQWRLLRAAVPRAHDDLFIVGDPHQRITDTRVTLSSVGIPTRAAHAQAVATGCPQELLSVRGHGCAEAGPPTGWSRACQRLYGLRGARDGQRPVVRAYDSPEAELAGLVATSAGWLEDGVPAERDRRRPRRTAGWCARPGGRWASWRCGCRRSRI